MDGVGGGLTRQVRAEERSETLDGGGGVLGPQGDPGSTLSGSALGMCSWGFGGDCPGRAWQKCSSRDREVISPWV